jgi:autotransporter-associated beta strand protein
MSRVVLSFTLLLLGGRFAHGQTWNNAAGGDWLLPSNWNTSTAPSLAGDSATFGPISTSAIAVGLSSDVTVGSITFDDITNNSTVYTIGTSGRTIFLNSGSGTGALFRIDANCTSSAIQSFSLGTTFSVTDAGGLTFDQNGVGRLEINGNFLLNGHTLTKTGTGAVRIKNSNPTMTGTINVQAGSFQFNMVDSLGVGGVSVNVASGADLNPALSTGGNITLGTVHISGNGTASSLRGALLFTGSGFTWKSRIVLDADAGVGRNSSNGIVFQGGIDLNGHTLTIWTGGFGVSNAGGTTPGIFGTGNLVMNNNFDAGTNTFSVANNYTGTTTFVHGSTFVNNAGALGSSATGTDADAVTVQSAAQLSLNASVAFGAGKKLYISGTGGGGGALSNNGKQTSWEGPIELNANALIGSEGGSGTLTLNGGISDKTFQLSFVTANGHFIVVQTNGISGSGGLLKSGPGTVIINSNSSVSGPIAFAEGVTPPQGGTLQVNANLSNAGTVTVNNISTLSGTGSIAGNVIVGGTDTDNSGNIRPGTAGPGTLTVGAVQFVRTADTANSYVWTINDWTGAGFSKLVSTGALSTSTVNATDKFKIAITGLKADNTVGAVPGFDPNISRSWVIGTFTNNLTASGITPSQFTLDTTQFAASNNLGGGVFSLDTSTNNLILNFSAVPEPGMLLGAGALILGLLRRRW